MRLLELHCFYAGNTERTPCHFKRFHRLYRAGTIVSPEDPLLTMAKRIAIEKTARCTHIALPKSHCASACDIVKAAASRRRVATMIEVR